MRKQRLPQGIWAQPEKLRTRMNQLLDAEKTYSEVQEIIRKEFSYELTPRALSDYFQKREKLKEAACRKLEMEGGAAITITISGPAKIRVMCNQKTEAP